MVLVKRRQNWKKKPVRRKSIFLFIAEEPVIFLVNVPVLFILLLAIGWSRESKIESNLQSLWIPDGDVRLDNDAYLESLGVQKSSTSFWSARAVSRDNENLFTESRLEEIRSRMEQVEATTIRYGGETFGWQDLCAVDNLGLDSNEHYAFPCLRYSPLDFFQEARGNFNQSRRLTWYNDVLHKQRVKPAVLRYGILQQFCNDPDLDACYHQALLRNNPHYAAFQGFDESYADPFALLSDTIDLQLDDPCRVCLEDNLEPYLQNLTKLIPTTLQMLSKQLKLPLQLKADRLAFENKTLSDLINATNVTEPPTEPMENLTQTQRLQLQSDVHNLQALTSMIDQAAANITRTSVEDFFYYYSARRMYMDIAADSYMKTYNQLVNMDVMEICSLDPPVFQCPPLENISYSDARNHLRNHADNQFSSLSTAGSPLPLWGTSNATDIFSGQLPLSGSGIDMRASMDSIDLYLARSYDYTESWEPTFADIVEVNNWRNRVLRNPIYAWFMAGVSEMTAHCGNEVLSASNYSGVNGSEAVPSDLTNFSYAEINDITRVLADDLTQFWCTQYSEPYGDDGNYTKQHFARMWYDLLIDSSHFFNVTQGIDDPYSYELGIGCNFSQGEERPSFTDKGSGDILDSIGRTLYTYDEGASIGPIDPSILIAGYPVVEGTSVLQNIYPLLGVPIDIVNRVRNCARPGGALEIAEQDAEAILEAYKKVLDDVWSNDWEDEEDGEVSFLSFSDDTGAPGSMVRNLLDHTLNNGIIIFYFVMLVLVFSVLVLVDTKEPLSMLLILVIGILLVMLATYSGISFAVILGIKVNLGSSWIVPFITMGTGMDDMYLVVMALKRKIIKKEADFVRGMRDVFGSITTTAVVKICVLACINISNVPFVYRTAQTALIALAFVYVVIAFCFPAVCYLLFRRTSPEDDPDGFGEALILGNCISRRAFGLLYRPLVLGIPRVRLPAHVVIWSCAVVFICLGIVGILDGEEGVVALQDFFPTDSQVNRWTTLQTETSLPWTVNMHWGALNYSEPSVQMSMMRQFEAAVGSPNFTPMNTKELWVADFAVWTTRQCEEDVVRSDSDELKCGREQIYPLDGSTCAGAWAQNLQNLKEKIISEGDKCYPYEEGVCRRTPHMHPEDLADLGVQPGRQIFQVWCPVFQGWSDDKLAFCLKRWFLHTGGGGNLKLSTAPEVSSDCDVTSQELPEVPLLVSSAPTMFAIGLDSEDALNDFVERTEEICSNINSPCWMTGVPFKSWAQYHDITPDFHLICGFAMIIQFLIVFFGLFSLINNKGRHDALKVLVGSIFGSVLVTVTTVVSSASSIGMGMMAGSELTAFSLICYVMNISFSAQYATHVVVRWLEADNAMDTAVERVDYAMSFLFLPSILSVVSSVLAISLLGMSDFQFIHDFVLRPWIIALPVAYFFGCWWLPSVLTWICFDAVKLGKPIPSSAAQKKNLIPGEETLDDGPLPRNLEEKFESADALEMPESHIQPPRSVGLEPQFIKRPHLEPIAEGPEYLHDLGDFSEGGRRMGKSKLFVVDENMVVEGDQQSRLTDPDDVGTLSSMMSSRGLSMIMLVHKLLSEGSQETISDFLRGLVYDTPDETLGAIYECEEELGGTTGTMT